jgi:dTDP-4-dehydrorhamnose 3,5-epimerase
MRFVPTGLADAFVVELEPHTYDRGFFARAFCVEEFEQHGLKPDVVQANLSYNRARGTLRGMHYQVPPATETKYLRCIRGAVHDVIVDMRPDSGTFLQHVAVELTADNRRALFVPELFAHGFQTLEDDTEVLYQVGAFYTPGTERGLRHDDPALGLAWPLPVTSISDKDRSWPLLEQQTGAQR